MDTNIGTGMGFSANSVKGRALPGNSASSAAASSNIDAVFEEKNKEVSVDSFLQLMIAQLKNQDFMNPMDDTQYVTQLAQFATMQQMQDLAYYSKSNYVMSLVGNDVTVAKLSVGGEVEKQTGPIEKVSLYQDEYYLFVGGKPYTLDQLMEVNGKSVSNEASDKIDVSDKAIVVGAVTDTTAQVSWPLASDDESLQNKLKYSIYYSEDRNMSTLDDVKQGKIFGAPNRVGLDEDIITGLEPDTVYYVNVVVTDHNGKESLYSQSVIKTKDEEEKPNEVSKSSNVANGTTVPDPFTELLKQQQDAKQLPVEASPEVQASVPTQPLETANTVDEVDVLDTEVTTEAVEQAAEDADPSSIQ